MRLFLILPCLALAAIPLAGCGVHSVASVSQLAMASADQSYITATTAGMQRVAAGSMTREQFTKLEQTAYAALLLIRAGANTAQALQAQKDFNAATAALNGGE